MLYPFHNFGVTEKRILDSGFNRRGQLGKSERMQLQS